MSESENAPRRLRADGEVTCEMLITFLDEYLAGELSPERARAAETHLARCPSCVAYLESYRETIELARGAELDLAAVPPDLLAAILAARA